MTKEHFEQTAFFKGQRAIFDGILAVEIVGFSKLRRTVTIQAGGDTREVGIEFVELLTPDPLTICREILRRLNDPLNEGYQTRLDSDLRGQIEKLFKNEQQV